MLPFCAQDGDFLRFEHRTRESLKTYIESGSTGRDVEMFKPPGKQASIPESTPVDSEQGRCRDRPIPPPEFRIPVIPCWDVEIDTVFDTV
jgi:hypothetical protein